MILNSIKNLLLKNVEKPIIKFFLFSIFDTLVGATGMLIYGIFTRIHGPIWVRNQFIGLWLTTLVMFISIQSLYIEVKSWTKYPYYLLDLIFFSTEIIINLLMIIFYSMARKIDASIWSVYLFSVNLTNLYILFARRKSVKGPKAENRSTEDPSITQPLNQNEETGVKSISKKLLLALENVNGLLKIIFLIFSCFLVIGACIDGTGRPLSRGKFINVRIDNTESAEYIKVHYLCSKNNKNGDNQSIFMIEGDATHGVVDLLSIQILLAMENKTSCIWDKPGLGFSDYLYNGMTSYNSPFYHNMIKEILANENIINSGKLRFVATGSFGADIIFQYALDHREMVESLTFLDVVPNNVEFLIKNTLSNFTRNEAERYKNKEYSSRQSFSNLKNAFGVPWGIISLYVDPIKAFFSQFNNEIEWFYYTEKKWATENYFINILKDKISSFSSGKIIDQTISLNLIISEKSDDQIIKNVCEPRKIDRNSKECIYEINFNRLLIQEKLNLANLSSKSKLIACKQDECGMEYFFGVGANYTVYNLLNEFNL